MACQECFLEITDNVKVNGINKFSKGEKMSINKELNQITHKRIQNHRKARLENQLQENLIGSFVKSRKDENSS